MSLLNITSPHAHGSNRTARLMQLVILATLPGLIALTWFFGWGYLINIVWCCLVALGAEAAVLKFRKRNIRFALSDCTALLTAVLLGLSLPPFVPWWVSAIATLFAIVFAKQLYGGLGNNPFNPAMAGYALVLVSFPVAMTTNWAVPTTISGQPVGFIETLAIIFEQVSVPDGVTGATALDIYKHQIASATAETVTSNPIFGGFVATGWEIVSLAYLAGGLFLLYMRVISWHIPVSFLAALMLVAFMFSWDADSSIPASLHLLAGATMLGAFFIATDPVSASTTPRGRLIYGAGIGILVYIIRTWGNYPDAVAFAVLLMNFAAPLIDYYTQPRTFGHSRSRRGLKEAKQ